MATPKEVLAKSQGSLPGWLGFSPEHLQTLELRDLFAGVCYTFYPGSCIDGECFKTVTAAGATAIVVHADYCLRPVEDIVPRICRSGNHTLGLNGYTIRWHRLFYAQDIPWFGSALTRGFAGPTEHDTVEAKGALFLLVRDEGLGEDHGVEKILFLHLKADAYGVMVPLNDEFGARPYLVVIHDHGFGGNYDPKGFEGKSRLYKDCLNAGILPDWLLVHRSPWEGYVACSDAGEPSGMHGSRRVLYRRDPS